MLQRRRWARGAVYLRRGKKVQMWYGRWWEDITAADGQLQRRYRKIRLGPPSEIPSRAAAMQEVRRHMAMPHTPATLMKFSELTEKWKQVHELVMKPSTFAHYKNTLRSVTPVFGDSVLTNITRHDIESYLLGRAQHYSRSTVRSMKTTLSLVLGWAASNTWLDKNPVTGIRLPRNFGGRTVKRNVLDPLDVSRLASAMEEPYSTLCLFLYVTGLRIAECAGLKWSDLSGNILHVQRRVYAGEIDEVKTRGSQRKLPLSDEILTRLLNLRTKEEDGFIFHARNGSPMNPGNWLKREIRPAAAKLDIRLSGWHDFRVSLTTNLRRQGTHPKLVSAILGHAKVQLALDVYDQASTQELTGPLTQLANELNPNEPISRARS